MYSDKMVVRVHGDLRVRVRFHAHPHSDSTLLLVHGSLSTSQSFNRALGFLARHCNVVTFDQPYCGESRSLNPDMQVLDMRDEAQVVLDLIEHFEADQLMAFSWGGVASLRALAQRPATIERAIFSSFSPILNPAMLAYLERGTEYLATCDRQRMAQLVNDTLGRYLPPAARRCNFRHVASLDMLEYAQMLHQIRELTALGAERFMVCASQVDVPLLFINGELDEHTTPTDALHFADLVRSSEYVTIRQAGHFLELENEAACDAVARAAEGFLSAGTQAPRLRRTA